MSVHDDIETIRTALTSGTSRSPRPDTKILYLPAEVSEPALAALDRIAAPACGDSVTLIERLHEAIDSITYSDDVSPERMAEDRASLHADLAVLELRESDRQSSESRGSGSASALEVGAGEMRESIQWRCPNMAKHGGDNGLSEPCPDCYSLVVTSVRIPYRERVNWHVVASATKPEASPSPEIDATLGNDQFYGAAVRPRAEEGEWRRLRSCVEQWPECAEGEYNPRCCRFPKSCSCTVYDPERVTDADLEPAAADPSSIEP